MAGRPMATQGYIGAGMQCTRWHHIHVQYVHSTESVEHHGFLKRIHWGWDDGLAGKVLSAQA